MRKGDNNNSLSWLKEGQSRTYLFPIHMSKGGERRRSRDYEPLSALSIYCDVWYVGLMNKARNLNTLHSTIINVAAVLQENNNKGWFNSLIRIQGNLSTHQG